MSIIHAAQIGPLTESLKTLLQKHYDFSGCEDKEQALDVVARNMVAAMSGEQYECLNCGVDHGKCKNCDYDPRSPEKCEKCGKFLACPGSMVKDDESCEGHFKSLIVRGKKRPDKRLQVEIRGLGIRKTFSSKKYESARWRMAWWVNANFGFRPQIKDMRVVNVTGIPMKSRVPDSSAKTVKRHITYRDSFDGSSITVDGKTRKVIPDDEE